MRHFKTAGGHYFLDFHSGCVDSFIAMNSQILPKKKTKKHMRHFGVQNKKYVVMWGQ